MNTLSKLIATGLTVLTFNSFASTNCPSFAGDVIVGKSDAADFTTLTEAVNALECGGVSGPVTIIMESGTYNERVFIASIPSVSAFNPVTIQSQSGNSADVVISYSATDASMVINGSYITLENISIDHRSGTYGNSLRVEGKASDLYFKSVVFDGVGNSVKGTNNATILFAGTATKENIVVEDCEINYGSVGMYKKGMSAEVPDTKTTVTGTLFYGQSEAGLVLVNDEAPVITNNVVSAVAANDGYKGILLDNVTGSMTVCKNILNASLSSTGLVMNNCVASATTPGQINSNTIAVNGNHQNTGICLSGNTDNQIFNFNRVKLSVNAKEAATQAFYKNTSDGKNINLMNTLFLDMNTGTYTVLGNSYKDFFNQLPSQSNAALSASANVITLEKGNSIK